MTSLSQQLKKLAVPQTSALVDLKKRPSILFDQKDAATKDRKTIFDLGYQGLQELIALNHSFLQFEKTLFQETTLHIERSVEDSVFNKQLDMSIDTFLYHLSPYFMTRSAQMALEWLIRRFQVHEFNKDSFVRLILPYHETNVFVKCVQVMKLRNHSDPWHWLSFIQKSGVPFTKHEIIKVAAKKQFLLSFVCTSITQAKSELGGSLQCLMNFYSSVVIGVLDSCKQIKEWHLTTILPSIIKGMKSTVVDYISASFMITSVLINKHKTNTKLLNALVVQICKINCEQLQPAQILLLTLIFKTGQLAEFPCEGFVDFISNKYLMITLSNLDTNCVPVNFIVSPLFCTSLNIIKKEQSQGNICRAFIHTFLNEIKLPDDTAKLVVRIILQSISLDSEKNSSNGTNTIDLEFDNESWIFRIIQLLEKQYPSIFDAVVKETTQSMGGSFLRNVICVAFRNKNIDENISSIFQKIYHSNPEIRATSFKEIVNQYNENKIKRSEYGILKEALTEVLRDDRVEVIQEVLKLSTEVLVDNVGCGPFTESIMNILDKATIYPDTWGQLQLTALNHLTTDIIVKNYDNNLLLLVLTRYFLPAHSDEKWYQYVQTIFESSFGKKSSFIQGLKKAFENIDIKFDDLKKTFLVHITAPNNSLCTEDLMDSVQKSRYNFFKTSTNISHFLVMLTASFKTSSQPQISREILKFTLNQCKQFKINQFSGNQWISGKNKHAIPLQLIMDFVQRLIETTNFSNLMNWESNTNSMELFLEIISFIMFKAFDEQLAQNEKLQWAMYLNNTLDIFFPSLSDKMNTLSNFFLYENLNIIENYSELRIRALKVMQVILKKGGNTLCLDLRLVMKVIVGLSSSHWCIRQCSLNVLKIFQTLVQPKQLQQLVGNILKKSESIIYDSEQISFLFYSMLNTSKKEITDTLLQDILDIIKETSESSVLVSKILEILKHIKTIQILRVAIQRTINVLDNVDRNSLTLLDRTTSAIFEATVMRFDENCIKEIITNDENAWILIEKAFKVPNTFITTSAGKLIPISCIILDIFDEPIYNQLTFQYRTKLLRLIIELISNSDSDVVFLDINRALRRCTIDCEQVLPLLDNMKNICSHEINLEGGCNKTTGNKFTTTSYWKEGIVLLEILENKKNLLNSEILVPILFDVLKRCLEIENQSPLEYTKQLILSSILQSCKCVKSQKLLKYIPANIFRIDLVVKCIRMTQNPETQFKALSLLTYSASLFPQQVLYNSLEIFTFIGSSIVRYDDTFSFQIISNVLESVVPILVESNGEAVKFDLVVPVLKVFSDILLDVPEHRRIPLYSKLLNTLRAETYFWIFLCVVFESLTLNEEKNSQEVNRGNQELPNSLIPSSSEKLPRKIEIALHLLHEFNINASLQTCVSLMTYVKTLPFSKEETIRNIDEYNKLQCTELFDVMTKSSKQLRHFKYLILQFVSTFTSSPRFLKAASIENENNKSTKDLYKQLMIKILSYLPDINDVIQNRKDSRHLKYWNVLLDHCYDALDNMISLLSPDMFLVVVCGLMEHKLITVRKEVVRLLINKLQGKNDYFLKCSDKNISNLLDSLYKLISTISVNNNMANSNLLLIQHSNSETIMLQQAGLIATKLLSKLFGMKYIDDFMDIVLLLTNIAKQRSQVSKIIFATVVLTVVEIVSNLKANAISHLPKCIPHLMNALRDHATIIQKHPADNVCLVLLTGVQKLVETMPLFLGPYIVDIISVLSRIWSKIQRNPAELDNRKQQIRILRAIWSKIANDVPSRILIPSCETAYDTLMKEQSFLSVGLVMNLLLECLSNLKKSELMSIQSELTHFFLKSLEFRSEIDQFGKESISSDDVTKIELEIISAFVAWVLKLSESSFKPVYKKIYDWAIRSNGPKGRVLTYFILNSHMSDSLKSIFVLFAGNLVLDTSNLLNVCNTNKNKDLFFLESDSLNAELLKNMLNTLSKVFMHGSKGFVNSHKFESLVPPIVDQLENNLVLNNGELQSSILNCIGKMAASVSNYGLWKSLNYHILMKTRSDKSQIRILAFNCCVELARTLGDDFSSLMPETIPFIAELFEDENPEVVENSRRAVQEIESILGESLQKYL